MSRSEPACPRCRVNLQPRVYEVAMIWSCPECEGTFMPLDQLQAITANETAPRTDRERQHAIDQASTNVPLLDYVRGAIPCPWCENLMHRSIYDGNSGIAIDQCDECGIWLDPGELQRAEAWREARRAGLEPDIAPD